MSHMLNASPEPLAPTRVEWLVKSPLSVEFFQRAGHDLDITGHDKPSIEWHLFLTGS